MRPPCCSSGGGVSRETSQPDSVLDYSNTKRKGLKSTPAPSSPPSVCTGKWLAAHQKSVGSGAHRLPSLIARASTATRGFRLPLVWWYCGLRLCLEKCITRFNDLTHDLQSWLSCDRPVAVVVAAAAVPRWNWVVGSLMAHDRHEWNAPAAALEKKSRAGGKAQFRSTPRNYGCR
jgi:hypothetical protein